ncbi:MAG: MFS transporter [Thermoplasmata archaeon]
MEYKWKAFSVTAVGTMMAAIDATIVLLALVPIAGDLAAGYVTIVWVVIAYLLATTAFILSFGRMSDLYGRKRMYNLGFVVFTIGSALSGFATDGTSLVVFRAIQGVGAALLTANSFAILSDAFPRDERGRAFGAVSVIWGIGSVVGIILGAAIITVTTWRAIFWINIPIGILGTLWAYRALREVRAPASAGESFDLPAAVLFTGGLTSLLFGVTWGLLSSWTDPVTLVSIGLAVPIFGAFLLWEARYSPAPILELGIFRERLFASAVSASLFQSMATFSVNFLLVFYLEGIYGLSILESSYLILPYAIAVAIFGPLGGRLVDRHGARRIALLGLSLQILSLGSLAFLTPGTPIALLGLVETIFGIGGGLFWPANTSMVMTNSPRGQYGVGSGILGTFRNTGMVLSFAVGLIAVTATMPATLVYRLFLGTFVGTLSPGEALQYLRGQAVAFGLGLLLLGLSLAMTYRAAHPARAPSGGGSTRPTVVPR